MQCSFNNIEEAIAIIGRTFNGFNGDNYVARLVMSNGELKLVKKIEVTEENKEEHLDYIIGSYVNTNYEHINGLRLDFIRLSQIEIEAGEYTEEGELIKAPVYDSTVRLNVTCPESYELPVELQYRAFSDKDELKEWINSREEVLKLDMRLSYAKLIDSLDKYYLEDDYEN